MIDSLPTCICLSQHKSVFFDKKGSCVKYVGGRYNALCEAKILGVVGGPTCVKKGDHFKSSLSRVPPFCLSCIIRVVLRAVPHTPLAKSYGDPTLTD